LVRTLFVKPPRGSGQVRLVLIGENGSVDLQPCGGTHVKNTSEIGEVAVDKIQNKGKINRRIRLVLVKP
jgi:misacylated tRNA(Ala) deacylase